VFYVIWVAYKHKFHFLVRSFGMNIMFCNRLINENFASMYIQFGKFWSIPQNDANLGQWATINTKFYMFFSPSIQTIKPQIFMNLFLKLCIPSLMFILIVHNCSVKLVEQCYSCVDIQIYYTKHIIHWDFILMPCWKKNALTNIHTILAWTFKKCFI
jgi:hypothetical protein